MATGSDRRAFRLERGVRTEGHRYYDVRVEWHSGIMGVTCPSCGSTWGTTGVQYPSVDPSMLEGIVLPHQFSGKRTSKPLTVEEFKELSAKLRPVLGPDRLLVPGTFFGPLYGRASGEIDDFVWPFLWTLLVLESVLHALQEAGFDLVAVPAEITFRRKQHEPLIELEALPLARATSSQLPVPCSVCGRYGVEVPPRPSIVAKSFNDSIPIQRILEMPTVLVVNGAFADFIREQKIVDAQLTPIDLT